MVFHITRTILINAIRKFKQHVKNVFFPLLNIYYKYNLKSKKKKKQFIEFLLIRLTMIITIFFV